MAGLFLLSEVIARLIDRRRARREAESGYGAYDDDKASPLALDHDPDDERPSRIDEDKR